MGHNFQKFFAKMLPSRPSHHPLYLGDLTATPRACQMPPHYTTVPYKPISSSTYNKFNIFSKLVDRNNIKQQRHIERLVMTGLVEGTIKHGRLKLNRLEDNINMQSGLAESNEGHLPICTANCCIVTMEHEIT